MACVRVSGREMLFEFIMEDREDAASNTRFFLFLDLWKVGAAAGVKRKT